MLPGVVAPRPSDPRHAFAMNDDEDVLTTRLEWPTDPLGPESANPVAGADAADDARTDVDALAAIVAERFEQVRRDLEQLRDDIAELARPGQRGIDLDSQLVTEQLADLQHELATLRRNLSLRARVTLTPADITAIAGAVVERLQRDVAGERNARGS